MNASTLLGILCIGLGLLLALVSGFFTGVSLVKFGRKHGYSQVIMLIILITCGLILIAGFFLIPYGAYINSESATLVGALMLILTGLVVSVSIALFVSSVDKKIYKTIKKL